LIFKVADLLIEFYCNNKEDASFLRKRYPGFLVEKRATFTPAGKIFLTKSRSQNVQVKQDKIYLPLESLRKDFSLFNIFFEIALMPILGKNRGFILHASSLVRDNLGYIFTGQEDSGKTTVRKLFPELVCLGDDTAILRKVGKQFFLFSSPFYQRDYKPCAGYKAPVASLFVLAKKADFNRVELLVFPENLRAVLSNAYISETKNNIQEKELLSKNCYEFCLKTKIFALSFKKDRSFWPLLERAVKKQGNG